MNFLSFSLSKSAFPLELNLSKNLLNNPSLSSRFIFPIKFSFSLRTIWPFSVSPIASLYSLAMAEIAILNCLNKSFSISSMVIACL